MLQFTPDRNERAEDYLRRMSNQRQVRIQDAMGWFWFALVVAWAAVSVGALVWR
jgi:hypothetical protein